MARDFEEWFHTFRESINTFDFYVDFESVYRKANAHKTELYLLNSLIGSKDIKRDFKKLVEEYPKVLNAVPILVAIGQSDEKKTVHCEDDLHTYNYNFNIRSVESLNQDKDDDIENDMEAYTYFMEQTGLFDLLQNRKVTNLYDYATGVEVGLDSNGRKNRSGHLMENLTQGYIEKANFKMVNYSPELKNDGSLDWIFFKELDSTKVEKLFGVDLSPITDNGGTIKRFDFVVKTPSTVYGIETNYYSKGGSKPIETSRSYKNIALGARNIKASDSSGSRMAKDGATGNI